MGPIEWQMVQQMEYDEKLRNEMLRKQMADNVAESLISQLAERDGRVHVAMYSCFGSLGATQGISADEKFNQYADQILGAIQEAGYEVVDVKFDGQYGIDGTQRGISYHLMVLYK